MYYVYKKTPNNKYKLEQNIGNQIQLRIFNQNDLPESIEEGDILRKNDDNFTKDEEATRYIKQKLQEIEQNVNNEFKK